MTQPIEEVTVRVTADTRAADRALRNFAARAGENFRDLGRQADQVSAPLLNLANQGDRLDDLGEAADRSSRDVAELGRALEELLARMSALTPVTRQFASALGRVSTQSRAAEERLRDLSDQLSASASRMDELGASTRDTSAEFRELRADVTPATRALQELGDDNDQAAAGTERHASALRGLLTSARAAVPALTGLGLGLAAVGSAVPALAGVAATVQAIGPAAAGAATGFVALRQATAAVQLGMIGVEEAVTAALDPSKADEFAKSIEGLAPNARDFATSVRDLQPAFTALQQSVQDRLFAGFGDELERLSTTVLPALRTGLEASATTLNQMALGAAAAARQIAANGTLGQALQGANQGLTNLSRVPGQIVGALGQIAAAGTPVFDRLTSAVAAASDRIAGRLNAAFESGALQDSINTALDLVIQLGSVVRNVFGIIGNVLGAASQSGAGFIGVLGSVVSSLRDATATAGFREAIGALAQTMSVIGSTVGPLLGQALAALGPVITALAGPVQILVQNLGAGLSSVIAGLAPVLASAARAVGSLLVAISPLLPVIGSLAGAILGSLTPVFDGLAQTFTALQPQFFQLAAALQGALLPVLSALPGIITPLVQAFVAWVAAMAPVATELLTALTPALISIGQSLGQLLTALSPVIAAIGVALAGALQVVAPALSAVIPIVGRVASVLANLASGVLNGVTIPSLRVLAQLLTGNFSGAWRTAQRAVLSAGQTMASVGRVVLNAVRSAFTSLVGVVQTQVGNVVSVLRSLPGRARAALSGASGVLVSVGRDIVAGLARGIAGGIGVVTSAARNLARSALNAAKSALGIASPSKEFASIGKDVGRGFIKGLTGTTTQIRSVTTDLANDITQAFRGRATLRDDRLVTFVQAQNNRLVTLANQRDSIAKRIADANKFAADSTKAAQDAFSLSAISQAAGGGVSRGTILNGLEKGVIQIRRFTAQINSLRKRGLRRDLLAQLIGLGPEAGAELAASLSRQSNTTLRQVNAQQAALVKASQSFGRSSADVLFDAGRQAGRGFLTGLKAQQKQIEALMLSIAKAMQRSIKRALGIRSPSTVFASIGDDTAAGLERGFQARVPSIIQSIQSAAESMGDTARQAVPSTVPLGQAVSPVRPSAVPPVSPQPINLTVVNRGVVGSRSEVLSWLTESLDTLARQRRLPA